MIYANKIDLKSLNVLILDGLQILPVIYNFLLESHICSCKKLYFQFLLLSANILSICGHRSTFELKLPKITGRIDKFHAKSAIPYRNTS